MNTIYSIHAVTALIDSFPERVSRLYVLSTRDDHQIKKIMQLAKAAAIPIKACDRLTLDKLAGSVQHQGAVAQCQDLPAYQQRDLPTLLAHVDKAFLLILDGVQDPHNLGACLRTAAAAGVHAVIVPKDRAVSMTPVVRKVACGAAEILPLVQVTNLSRTINWLKEQGIWIYGLTGEATTSIHATPLQKPLALVLGAEGRGLRKLTASSCDHLLSIPMPGNMESLNVSVAAGIGLFEVVRQMG